MIANLSPAISNALIAVFALGLLFAFWGVSRGVKATDTILIRITLAVLLLPFVIGGILGAVGMGDTGYGRRTVTEPPVAGAPPPPRAKATGVQSQPDGVAAQRPAPPSRPPAPPAAAPAPAPSAAPPVRTTEASPPPVASAPAPGSTPRAAPPPAPPAAAPAPEAAPPPAAPKPDAAAADQSSAPWDVVPVYFGTDRKPTGISERVEFGSERARKLDVGRALVTVPKIHEIPNVERPWVYRLPFTRIVIYEEKEDPRLHFTIKELRVTSREELAGLVRDRLASSRNFKDHALLFVHGFNTTFEAALFRTAQIAYDLKYDGAPFVYSWPSKGQIGFQDYSYDRESAGQAEPYLKEMVDFVMKESGAKTLSIIAHSMGNQVLLPVLRDLKRTAPPGVTIAQIILAAPDVDRDTFEFLAKEISGVGQGITMLAASNDRALTASRRFWGGVPRAGDVAEDGPVVVPGIDTIDVTAVSTEMLSLNHSGYAQKQQVLEDIGRLLKTGTRPPDKRMDKILKITTPRGDFWRIP